MIAALYCRKSTDDSDRNAEARSTRRQIESATAYAERKGWTVDPRYIFVDENTSDAEWKHRPGFNALLAALEPRSPFGVVIVSELSRIGRHTVRTPAAVMRIEEAGVEIRSYLSDAPISLADESSEIHTIFNSLAASFERRRARQRTYDALRRRAEAGAVTGGRVYGYRNERNGTGFVHRAIDETDDSASELVGTHALRRGLRCCLSLWRTAARCARVPPRVETDMKAALGVIAAAMVFASGCAQKDWIDRTLVTVDVTGVWEGTQDFGPGGGGGRDIVIVLQQQGAKVTGEIRNSATALGAGAPQTLRSRGR